MTVNFETGLSVMGKINVGIIFGGKSAEHEVSLQSAKSIIEAIDKDKYSITLIGIDQKGRWFLNNDTEFLLNADNPETIKLQNTEKELGLVPGDDNNQLVSVDGTDSISDLDVVFPVLHGPFGEDGTVQGLLKLANIPYVGAGVLGSSVGMDKDVMKRLLRDAGIPNARYFMFTSNEASAIDYNKVTADLGTPLFIKPANLGSSVGVSKVSSEKEFKKAVAFAFEFDHKIIIEENITGREIECSVLGNEEPEASIPGEIMPQHDFYSYEAKYIDEKGATLKIPAELPDHLVKKVQDIAVKTFKVLCCEGMARVDIFLTDKEEIFVNEINTIPGFTKISMYPKLWEATGLSYTDLIDRLIGLAIERFERDNKLKTKVQL
jgi:D-alanine-D-alanine ligase